MHQHNHKSILLIGNFLSKSVGTQGINESLASLLSGLNWDVITTSSFYNKILRLIDMLFTVWNERQNYKVAQIDVFSGAAFYWAEATIWLLKKMGKPYIITLRGGNLPKFSDRYPEGVKTLLISADYVTTPSHYLKEAFTGIRDDIIFLPNGLDINSYKFHQRNAVRPKLTWLRAFHSIYNPALAAQTISRLVDEFQDIDLTMFGPDKGDGSLQSMQSMAQNLGVADRITVTGSIPKETVPQRLSQYDIFLNTTTAESFGVSVVEAAALGMCIVTTNVGELPYIWTHEHDALLVPPNDPEAMANAIRRILTEPGLAEKLSRNARAKAETFDWSVILPQWEALLTEVIEQS